MNWSPDWVKKSTEISMKRMGISYIDLYALHGGSSDVCTDEFISTLQGLKTQGIIRAYGVNTFDTDFLTWIAKEKCFDYVMLDYNIMKQEREDLIEELVNSGVGVISGASLGQALYSKNIFKVRNRNDLWYLLRTLAHFRSPLKRSKDFRFLNKHSGFTANQLALRYVLDNDNVSSAVFTTTSIEHLNENLKAVDIRMPEQIRKEIKSHS